MGFISRYKEGMRLFQEKEYAKAIECFDQGLSIGHDSECALMLGKCFEHGLGVEKDLVLAKDFYKCALIKQGFMHSQDCEMIIRLKSKIAEMTDIADINELSRYIESVGCVKVKRTKMQEWSIKFNEGGTVINLAESRPLFEGLGIAKAYSHNKNKNWTCDGYTRFYDGYTLDTDFFSLVVKRGTTREYKSNIDGRNCTVIFPCDANLGYLYVQGTIMNKVLDLLRKRAEVVFPQKLNELSQRMGIPYGKCKISKNMMRASGECFYETRNIHIALRCIMIPEEYLEAICAHELTHCLVPNHEGKFWQTFKERAGEYLVSLDVKYRNGQIPYRWQPLIWSCRP